MSQDVIFPIGRLDLPQVITGDHVLTAIEMLEGQPTRLRRVMAGVADVDRPIRPGAWTVRQVLFHLADAHTLALIRTQVALSSEVADVAVLDDLVSARLNACTATLPDVRDGAVEDAVTIFTLTQRRWCRLLRSLDGVQVSRSWTTSQYAGPRSIARLVLAYAWHGNHHIAQVERSASTMG